MKIPEPPAVLREPWWPVLGAWQHWYRVGISWSFVSQSSA